MVAWLRVPLFATIYQLPYELQSTYLNNVLKSQWVVTSEQEWNGWPDNAKRCNETDPLGDFPLTLLVANSSESLPPNETKLVANLSTNSTTYFITDATHQFVMNEKYTPVIAQHIKESWQYLKSKNQGV